MKYTYYFIDKVRLDRQIKSRGQMHTLNSTEIGEYVTTSMKARSNSKRDSHIHRVKI